MPFGLAVGDMLCGTHFAQGMLAALVRRGKTGRGALVEASLLESLLDFQFEVLTTHFNDGGQLPRAPGIATPTPISARPTGFIRRRTAGIAIAMGCLASLGKLIGCAALIPFADDADRFNRRDEIKAILADAFDDANDAAWLAVLETADYWCADVFNYDQLSRMRLQGAGHGPGRPPSQRHPDTLRCPIRIDGQRLYSDVAAPALGESRTPLLNGVLQPDRP